MIKDISKQISHIEFQSEFVLRLHTTRHVNENRTGDKTIMRFLNKSIYSVLGDDSMRTIKSTTINYWKAMILKKKNDMRMRLRWWNFPSNY